MAKYLPVGIQDFEKMMTGDFLYVDKTRYVYRMARPLQGFYFLARPRRFGKSLLVSTFDALFSGKKALFEGLAIGSSDWEWTSHPVIKIDFNTISFETPAALEAKLIRHLHALSEKNEVPNPNDSLKESFAALITGLRDRHDRSVVVLIDEYDKPIIDHLGQGGDRLETAKQNRDVLKRFFGVLKGGEVSSALRFVFITGISKFARVSIFSDLNNLNDISMDDSYAALLGYTESELTTRFDSWIEKTASSSPGGREGLRTRIRDWYDGYQFSPEGERVYNPFSVIQFFEKGRFSGYWFETATPSFLVNLIRERDYPPMNMETLRLPEELFSVYDLDRLQLEPLLFQTGYITIESFVDDLYRMGYPNREVKTAFTAYLFNDLARLEDSRLAGAYKLLNRYLKDEKPAEFINTVHAIFSGIPYTQIVGQGEAFYHTLFYLMLSASGVDVQTEPLTSRGRIDIAVEFSDKVYVIELKCNQSAEAAIRQIRDKGYADRYRASGRRILLMGIGFDTRQRTISGWRMESV